jgi:coenzyme PQQ precursor peptide PqqA
VLVHDCPSPSGRWRAIGLPLVQHLRLGSVRFHRSNERILNLFLYRAKPLLSSCRTAFQTPYLGFQFPDPIFRIPQLKREPMRHSHCALDIVFRDVRCFFEQTDEGVAGLRIMSWTTPSLVEICIGLEINGYLPAEF